MWLVYILYSASIDSYYIGQTEDIANRFQQHQSHSGSDTFTKRADDWKVFLQIKCDSRYQALSIERHIKRMKSRNYLKNLLLYPEIAQKLIEKYS
jgi:putative endonuclease